MKASNLTLCYEGIQRVYRNSVVRHIRARFTSVYPDDFQARLKKPFKEEEWEEIKESAYERRGTGEVSTDITDDFDLLGVNHFFNIFELQYDAFFEGNKAISKEQKQKERQALLQWMKTVKSLRDPLSHPSEQDFPFEDSFVLLDCARRVLLRLRLEDEAKQIKALMDQLGGKPLSIQTNGEPLEDRLPPRESIVVDFVGRESELRQLWAWFQDPLSRRWALAGEGGKGKTALAFQFGTQVKFKAPQPFHIVLWLSAKKRKYEEGSVQPVDNPDFHDLESALSRVLTDYGWIEELSNPLDTKRSRVLELLDKFPALVIVDDIDSLEGKDEDAIEFFTFAVPQTKSRVLFTSRRVIFGMGNVTTHIGGLNIVEAEQFILSRCRLMEVDRAVLTGAVKKEIINITEGSPLYIEDLIRLCTVLPIREAMKIWHEKGGDEARQFALGRELDLLTKPALHVLVAACVPDEALSFPELEAVTGFEEDQLSSALSELQRLFLIPKARLIEGEQRFDVNVNTRALVRKVQGSSDLYRRVATAHKAVSGKLPKVGGRREISAIVRQAVFHVRNNEQPKAEQLLSAALEKKVNDSDLTGILGWVYKAWDPPRVTDAREKFKRAWQLKCANSGMYKHWCRMEIEEREWTKAAEAAERGLKFLPDNRLFAYMAGYSRSRLGKELLAGLHNERAQEELLKAQGLLVRALKSPEALEAGERQLNADIYRALVLNCELLHDKTRLRDYFKRWLGEHPDDPNAQSEWLRLREKFSLC